MDDPEMEAMAARMGMGRKSLATLNGLTRRDAEAQLADMKARLKAAFKAMAFDVHPDRNPEDGIAIGPAPRSDDVVIHEKTYAERERERVERARELRRKDRERKATAESKVHRPTEDDVRKYGEPEDPPRKDDGIDVRVRGMRYGVGISFHVPFITDA